MEICKSNLIIYIIIYLRKLKVKNKKTYYYEDGNILKEIYFENNKSIEILYYKNGNIKVKYYYENDKPHRDYNLLL